MNGIMKNTPPAHENIVHLLPHRFVPLHSSHFVALHLNFFFDATYVFYLPIKSMCGTRETLHIGILGSDQGESPFTRPVHHHREDVLWPQLVDDLAQETTNEWHCLGLIRAICGKAQGEYSVYTMNHIDDGLIACRLTSI